MAPGATANFDFDWSFDSSLNPSNHATAPFWVATPWTLEVTMV